MTHAEALQEVTNGYRLPNPDNSSNITCPAKLYDTMKSCWEREPSDRPSFAELRDFFNSYCIELEVEYNLDDDAEQCD